MKPSHMHAARAGRLFVAAELTRRGANAVELTPSEPGTDLRAVIGRQVAEFVVKSRRTGDWQVRASLGEPQVENANETRFWVLVDLGRTFDAPGFFIAPEWWIKNDIHLAHEAYLARHGGHRAVTEDSDHHRITTKRVQQWRGSWDAVGS